MSKVDLRGAKVTMARSFLLGPDLTGFETYIVPCEVFISPAGITVVEFVDLLLSSCPGVSTTSRTAVVT